MAGKKHRFFTIGYLGGLVRGMGGLNGIYDGSEWEKKAALVIEELAAFLKKAPAAAPFPLKPPGQLKE